MPHRGGLKTAENKNIAYLHWCGSDKQVMLKAIQYDRHPLRKLDAIWR